MRIACLIVHGIGLFEAIVSVVAQCCHLRKLAHQPVVTLTALSRINLLLWRIHHIYLHVFGGLVYLDGLLYLFAISC